MLLPRFAVPAAVATVSGIGLDLMGNILPAWWPDAPHYVWTGLIWISGAMIAAFPIWLIWAVVCWFQSRGYQPASVETARIFVECRRLLHQIPYPPSGRLRWFYIQPIPVEHGGGGLIESMGIPGSPSGDMPSPGLWMTTFECILTNYAKETMFNVQVSLHLTIRTSLVPDRKGMLRSGDVILDRDWPIWPAPGFEDTELGVFMEPEVDHGTTEIYAGVQA